MDWWLYYGIGSIDCVRMSVREVSEKAMFYRKRHLQFVMILIPFALILFGWLAYVNSGDIYLLAGMAAGAFFGLAIGLYHLSQFLRDYKTLNSGLPPLSSSKSRKTQKNKSPGRQQREVTELQQWQQRQIE